MTWVGPGLEAVVAEIRDATDADARGDVGGRPAGQDRDRDALRPCLRDPGQPPERAPGERHDHGRAGVSRALGPRSRRSRRRRAAGRAGRPTRRWRRSRSMSDPAPRRVERAGSRRDVDPGQDELDRATARLGHGRGRGGLADVEGGRTRCAGRAAGGRSARRERGSRRERGTRRERGSWARPIPRPTGSPSGCSSEQGSTAPSGRGSMRRDLRAPAPRWRSRPRGRRRSTGDALIRAGAYQYERSTAVRGDRCYDAAPMAILDRFRTRIVPAVLTALGVALLVGGLLSYTNPVTADPAETETETPSPVAIVATPSPSSRCPRSPRAPCRLPRPPSRPIGSRPGFASLP